MRAATREAMVDGFADALRRLAADPDHAEQLGRCAREAVLARFDWRKKVLRILEVYRDAVRRYRADRQARASRAASPRRDVA